MGDPRTETRATQRAGHRRGLSDIEALWIFFLVIAAITAVVYFGVQSSKQPQGINPNNAPGFDEVGNPVDVTFTSDPEGAVLHIDGQRRGVTPATVTLDRGERVSYRIVALEPYEDYDLYKPFTGKITPNADEAISVWLERTTAEEQAVQRGRAAAERERERQRQIEANVRASRWVHSSRRDPITDENSSLISTRATEYPSILQEDARLYIRCDTSDPYAGYGIVVIIAADDFLDNDPIRVDYRFNDRPSVTGQTWGNSTDGDAAFARPSQIPGFIQQLAVSSDLFVRLRDYRGTRLDYEFDVQAAGDALRLLGCYRGHIPE